MTVADTLISSFKVLAMLAWLKQLDLTGHVLKQYKAPVRAKPDSMPRLEGMH